MAIFGFVRDDLCWLWIGGVGLVVAGVILLFSLGIQLAIFGSAVLLAAFLIKRLKSLSRQ